MSLFIDKKFINIVSPQLDKFVWKKDNLANCRCPICGDSTTNKNKARGYFLQTRTVTFISVITAVMEVTCITS